MLLSDLAGVLVLTVIFQPSHQGPVQLGSEDQSLDQSFPYVPSEPQFGQRLHPLRSSARQSSVPPTHLSTFLSTPLSTPSAEIEEYNGPLEQRSLLTGDPIVVNKSEGACAFEGRIYQSGENIQRNHLCHFCFCRNGYIDCYWKNCPPAPEGCIELNYEGVCERSLYHCPIPSTSNIPLPRPVRSSQRYQRHISKQNFTALGCNILGVQYKVGELVGVATDPCLECRCAINALYCSPKCCFQPAEPDDVSQQLQRSAGHQPVLSNPLQHLRSEFSRHLNSA